MTESQDKSLVINGFTIEPNMLEPVALQRCDLAECLGACCGGGVWLNESEAPRIIQYKDEIKKHLPVDRHDESKWISDPEPDPDMPSGWIVGTNTVDDPQRAGMTCCVFLTEQRLCALQIVSRELNLGWPGIKPYYCALYPLWTDGDNLTKDDETHEWLNAGCERPATTQHARYQIFREESILVLGEEGYHELCRALEDEE